MSKCCTLTDVAALLLKDAFVPHKLKKKKPNTVWGQASCVAAQAKQVKTPTNAPAQALAPCELHLSLSCLWLNPQLPTCPWQPTNAPLSVSRPEHKENMKRVSVSNRECSARVYPVPTTKFSWLLVFPFRFMIVVKMQYTLPDLILLNNIEVVHSSVTHLRIPCNLHFMQRLCKKSIQQVLI